MLRGAIYLTLLIAFVLLSVMKGDYEERRVAIALLFASVASLAAVIIEQRYFEGINITMFFVDVIFLLYLFSISLYSEKYWPLWVSSLQILNATIHLVILLIPDTLPRAYAVSQGIWSYFQMLIVSFCIIKKQLAINFRSLSK